MKYDKELYINSGFYEGDEDIVNHKEKVVKCRKPHECMGGCGNEIKAGDYALLETGFVDGSPVSSYTCLPCIEEWLEESGQVEIEEQPDNEANKTTYKCSHCNSDMPIPLGVMIVALKEGKAVMECQNCNSLNTVKSDDGDGIYIK